MPQRKQTLRMLLPLALAVAVTAGLATLIAQAQQNQGGEGAGEGAGNAANQQTEQLAPEDARVVVGVYNPSRTIRDYPGMSEMQTRMEEFQQQFQAAQQEGNTQELMQLRQTARQEQQQFFEKFRQDVQNVIPEVASDDDVDLVVQEGAILHRADDVATKNVSETVIRALGGEPTTQPAMPQPRGGQPPAPRGGGAGQ